MPRARLPRSALALLAIGAAACTPARAMSTGVEATATTGPAHIVVIVMENHEYGAIMDPGSDAPTFRALAAGGVTLSHLYAITHPSLPNYLALTSGSTHGITSDCTTCLVPGRNLIDQLAHASIDWKAYMESIPSACSTTPYAGTYAMKHDPFMYYLDVRSDPGRCDRVVPLGQLKRDLAASALPRFAWITPNLCHDMHDCSVATGDRFLHTWVPRIVPQLGQDGIVIVLFDEGSTSLGCCDGQAGGGHIAALIAGPGAAAGAIVRTRVDQYSVLRLIEDAFGLHRLGGAATAPAITGWQPT